MVTMDLLGDDGLMDLRRRGARTDPEAVVREERERPRPPGMNRDLAEMARAPARGAAERRDDPRGGHRKGNGSEAGHPEASDREDRAPETPPRDGGPPRRGTQAAPGADGGGEADPLAGTCHVCRQREGTRMCQGCSKPTCAADHWLMFGLCRTCASEDRVRRWQRGGRPADENWLGDPP